jgi:hypothetical protein
VISVCSQVRVSATGRSLVQRSPIVCGVSEWNLEISTTDETLAHWGCQAIKKLNKCGHRAKLNVI